VQLPFAVSSVFECESGYDKIGMPIHDMEVTTEDIRQKSQKI